MKVVKQKMKQVKYAHSKIEMEIPGIPMDDLICTVKKDDILSIIHQEPIMKLNDGVCADGM